MADNDKTTRGVTLDPNFFRPPNVIDLRYLDADDNKDFSESDSITAVEVSLPIDTPMDTGPVNDGSSPDLPIPDGITFISQTVRNPSGGAYLVDVVIDIPDIPGVDGFEVSVAKA